MKTTIKLRDTANSLVINNIKMRWCGSRKWNKEGWKFCIQIWNRFVHMELLNSKAGLEVEAKYRMQMVCGGWLDWIEHEQ